MRTKYWLSQFIALIFMLSVALFSVTQQYIFNQFNVDDGLAQSQVYAITEDENGFLWLGTRGGGISVFDGFEFKTYQTKDGLNSNYINRILPWGNKLVIASTNGLNIFEKGQFKSWLKGDKDKNSAVTNLAVNDKNQLVCASSEGFQLFEFDGTPIPFTKASISEEIISFHWGNDSLLLGTNNGLFLVQNDSVFDLSLEYPSMKNAITLIKKDAFGTYWIGTYGDGVYCLKNGNIFRIDEQHQLYKQTIFDIHFDEQEVWLATLNQGVLIYNKTTKGFTRISENEGLSNNHIRSIYQDRNANYWIGSSGAGVNQYLGKLFTSYDQKTGLAANFIYSVFRDSKDRLWIGTGREGVTVLHNDSIYYFNSSTGFKNVKVKSITEDKDGNIWLATDGQGVYRFDDEEFVPVNALNRAYVKQMMCDQQGTVWIATLGSGIISVQEENNALVFNKWTTSDSLLSNRIQAFAALSDKSIAYATDNEGIGFFTWSEKDNMYLHHDDALFKGENIRCMVEDKHQRLWVGTAGNGVFYQEGKEEWIKVEDLSSENCYSLILDEDGNVVLGTEKGIDVIFLNEKGNVTQLKHYGKRDGFSGVETCQHAVFRDKDGSIWFGTVNGLIRFNPKEKVANKKAPLLSLSDVKLFYVSLENFDQFFEEPLLLKHTENHLSFDFIGVHLVKPEKVSYKWRLLGLEDSFSPLSKERSIQYSNLDPGKYTFEVMAVNEDGAWSEPVLFSFEIKPPFWQTPFFFWGALLIVLLILVLIYWIITRRVKAKAKERENQIRLEKEVLELEQKAMRLQMNPHFIFNAMNSIQSLIGSGNEKDARYYLAKFSRLMRQILDNSRKQLITLQEEVEMLENYLKVETFCSGLNFDYEIHLDDNLEPDFIQIPPMLIQPFVENAIKHGMKGFTAAQIGKISITMKDEGDWLLCVISDNGIGRAKAEELKQKSKETYHESAGLNVTAERIRRMANFSEEPLEIIDLVENEVPKGTKVILRIPIHTH